MRAPVYGYRFAGEWLDIGDRDQLLEADNRLRERSGLQPRAEYRCSTSSRRRVARPTTGDPSTSSWSASLASRAPVEPRVLLESCSCLSAASSAPARRSALRGRASAPRSRASAGPRCERCGAPTAWPVRRCRRVLGPAARVRRAGRPSSTTTRSARSSWPGRSAGCAGSPPRGDRRRGASPGRRAPLDLRRSEPSRTRGQRGHHPGRSAGPSARRRWQLPVLARRSPAPRAPGSAASRSPSAARERPRALLRPRCAAAGVVLVDDVYTSGATVDAAASALRERAPGASR